MKEVKLSSNSIYQSVSGFQFAFVSKDMRQCHGWVTCRDALLDAIFKAVKKQRTWLGVYDPKRMPLFDMSNLRIIITGDIVTERRIENLQEFLNKVEAKLGFKKSTIEEVDGIIHNGVKCKGKIFLIVGDKKWMHAPPLISLFSLYIRIGLFHIKGSSYDDTIGRVKKGKESSFFGFKYRTNISGVRANDPSYLRSTRKLRLLIMEHGIKLFSKEMKNNYNTEAYGIVDTAGVWDWKCNLNKHPDAAWKRTIRNIRGG